jgi:hypothetical protein
MSPAHGSGSDAGVEALPCKWSGAATRRANRAEAARTRLTFRCPIDLRQGGKAACHAMIVATDRKPEPAMTEERIPKPDAKTIDAYESTHYFAHEAKPVLLRIGDPASQHQAWLEKRGAQSATILTAWNPLGEEKSAAENARAQEALLSAIRARDLRWLPASGEDPAGAWQPEPGFCVFDVPDEVLDEWLVVFRQNAAVQATRNQACRLVWHPSIRGN